jgi:hypothetical protein
MSADVNRLLLRALILGLHGRFARRYMAALIAPTALGPFRQP